MNNLIIGGNVYNDEHKFLIPWLENISKLNSKIVIIDDGSTDNSLSICSKYTSYIFQTNRLFEQGENKIRQLWWEKATEIAEEGDFIFPLDTDVTLTENSILYYYEELEKCIKNNCDALCGTQYDMWNKEYYREEPEKKWVENLHPWKIGIKYKKNYKYYWNEMPIHCGQLPINAFFSIYPTKIQGQHWGYSTPELRRKKVDFYNKYDPYDITEVGKIRYDSIMDENPHLYPFIDNYIENNYNKNYNKWIYYY